MTDHTHTSHAHTDQTAADLTVALLAQAKATDHLAHKMPTRTKTSIILAAAVMAFLATVSSLSVLLLVRRTQVGRQQILQTEVAALNGEVGTLNQQIARDKSIIAGENDELRQAVAAILKLAKQVESLGGDPGKITISPPGL